MLSTVFEKAWVLGLFVKYLIWDECISAVWTKHNYIEIKTLDSPKGNSSKNNTHDLKTL